jgi:predicted amidohydrolase
MFDDRDSRKGQHKMQIRVGLLQMADCGPHKHDLVAKGEAYCRRAAAMGADIALFPETWYIGSNHFVDLSWSQEECSERHDRFHLCHAAVVPIGISLACLSIQAPTRTGTATSLVRPTLSKQVPVSDSYPC